MKIDRGRGRRAVLALVLFVAGGGFIWFGLRGLVTRVPAEARVVATATRGPTPTEPILPPPPTHSPTAPATASPPQLPASQTPEPAPSLAPSPRTAQPTGSPAPVATLVSETVEATAGPDASPEPTATRPVPATPPPPLPTATAPPQPLATDRDQRIGVCAAGIRVTRDLAARLGLGWYLDWSVGPERYRSAGVEYVPMIRLHDGKSVPAGQALLAAVDAQPGALWLIGNEPDVKWQDNTSAEVYARQYHDLYDLLKARDPTCQVAIGGISQPTPLRLRYLDRILDAYRQQYGEPMPVDVWNVHNFILREELGSWGVDIPPGMADQTGRLREIADHDDLAIFRRQIVDFRRWMKERGQQDKPLIVTEYGILMPADYGFPPAEVEQFMLGTFDYFNTAADPALGDPSDGYRLVQRWCWYSLADERYPTGNLVDAGTGALTRLGKAYRDWATGAR